MKSFKFLKKTASRKPSSSSASGAGGDDNDSKLTVETPTSSSSTSSSTAGTKPPPPQAAAAAAVGAAGAAAAAASSGKPEIVSSTKTTRRICEQEPTMQCKKRIRKDISDLYKHPLPGVSVFLDEEDMTRVWALIVGPFDTPYEGGFFLFDMSFPYDYPQNPPKVILRTTDGGRVRFNPNLYANGKVCLSILGTWSGPGWSPVQNIGSVLLSIQSLMNDRPYCNEPGFEDNADPKDIRDYADMIRHEVLRVAVLDMAGNTSMNASMPMALRSLVRDMFLSFADVYQQTCENERFRDGSSFRDPLDKQRSGTTTFQYTTLLMRVRELVHERTKELNQESK